MTAISHVDTHSIVRANQNKFSIIWFGYVENCVKLKCQFLTAVSVMS